MAEKISKDQIMEAIESMSVLDLSELIKALEEKFGVSAAAPAAVAVSPAVGASPAEGGEAVEEKSSFNVILSNAGANKIAVIKAIREIVPTLGLKEAKDLADSAPKPIAEGLNKEAANEAKTKLEAAGGTVELK